MMTVIQEEPNCLSFGDEKLEDVRDMKYSGLVNEKVVESLKGKQMKCMPSQYLCMSKMIRQLSRKCTKENIQNMYK